MTGWLFEAVLASTLLMAVVMMVRRPAARLVGARASYLLWTLPPLRMILPPLPSSDASLPVALGQRALIVFHDQAIAPVEEAGLPWVEIGIALWLAGTALFVLIQLVGYFRFERLMLSDGEIVGREDGVTIIESAHASGPLAFGVLRKYVVLPVDFADRFDAEERSLALAHECAHHDRSDLAANMAALGVLALHWWNPVAWAAYRAFRADQELACDALVMARHERASAAAYGRAILKAASGRHIAAACHLKTVDTLKGRLKMLTSHSASLHRISWGMAVVAAVTVTGLALTASGSGAARQMAEASQTVRNANMTKLASFMPLAAAEPAPVKAVAVPAAPKAPAAPDAWDAPEAPAAHGAPAAPAAPAPVMAAVPPVAPIAPTPPDLSSIPTADEIAAMIPRIDVVPGCGRDGPVTTETTLGANGRAKHVQIMICRQAAIDARREARMAAAEARRGEIEGRQAALAGLRKAREGVARASGSRDRAMSAQIRAQVVADLDKEIARLEKGFD